MRVLQLSPQYFPSHGGVERHVQAISEELSARGHEMVVVTMATAGMKPGQERINDVEVLRFRSIGIGRSYRAPPGLLRYLRRSRHTFDLIHAHSYHACLLPIAALFPRERLVVTTHLNDRAHSRLAQLLHIPYRPLGCWSLTQAGRVICVSGTELQCVAARFPLLANRAVVIPNGIDVESMRSCTSQERREEDLLLVVSRLEGYKRVDLAIEALAALPHHYRMVIVGHGSLRHPLAELARRRKVAGHTVFVGSVSDGDLHRWYRRASVLINLSTAEAFGLSVLEAVAAGCRVVCSDIPAFRELAASFPDHVTCVPAHSPAAVASAVRRCAQTLPDRSPDLTPYSWSAVVDRLLAVYRDLLQANRVRVRPSPDIPVPEKKGLLP